MLNSSCSRAAFITIAFTWQLSIQCLIIHWLAIFSNSIFLLFSSSLSFFSKSNIYLSVGLWDYARREISHKDEDFMNGSFNFPPSIAHSMWYYYWVCSIRWLFSLIQVIMYVYSRIYDLHDIHLEEERWEGIARLIFFWNLRCFHCGSCCWNWKRA